MNKDARVPWFQNFKDSQEKPAQSIGNVLQLLIEKNYYR